MLPLPKRIIKIALAIVACIAAFYGFGKFGLLPTKTSDQPKPITETPVNFQIPRSQTAISIGTFNIQTFGVKKFSKPEVMDVLVKVVRQFDCLAIQELRSKDQTIIPKFVEMINSNGSQYRYEVGVRQGNTDSKEQYVYIYDSTRIEQVTKGFNVPDVQNLIHREPWVTTFRTRTADPNQAFTFALVNIHTDPDETKTELAAMYDTYHWLRRYLYMEDDVIILGDFNEPPKNYGRLGQIQDLYAVIPSDVATNTAGNHSYDNVLFNGRSTREYTGQAGVLNLMTTFDLTKEQAKQVSDHMPVWALFTSFEVQPTHYANGQPTSNPSFPR